MGTDVKSDLELSIFTLNCWGIPGLSKDRGKRMCAIALELATGNFDFVCLQEVWVQEDFFLIKKQVEAVLPYAFYFYSGVIGAGLCIFSKYPIYNTYFHQWPLNGYMHKIQHGDWFGGKGIGLCQVLCDKLKVNIYTTHLHAEYDRVNDEYLAHRVTQAFEMAQFIHLTSDGADVVILGGDLNIEPNDIAYKLISSVANLEDAFVCTNHDVASEDGTCDTPNNSYTPPSLLNSYPRGKRIDYILFRSGRSVRVDTVECHLPLSSRVPGEIFSYSDHEAVHAKLKVQKIETVEKDVSDNLHGSSLSDAITVCEEALQKLDQKRRFYWLLSALQLVVLLCFIYPTEPPFYHRVLAVLKVLLGVGLCFTVIMGTLWNRIETNGILSGKQSMAVVLANVNSKYKQA